MGWGIPITKGERTKPRMRKLCRLCRVCRSPAWEVTRSFTERSQGCADCLIYINYEIRINWEVWTWTNSKASRTDSSLLLAIPGPVRPDRRPSDPSASPRAGQGGPTGRPPGRGRGHPGRAVGATCPDGDGSRRTSGRMTWGKSASGALSGTPLHPEGADRPGPRRPDGRWARVGRPFAVRSRRAVGSRANLAECPSPSFHRDRTPPPRRRPRPGGGRPARDTRPQSLNGVAETGKPAEAAFP
jgi:hypothetical protein